MYSRTNLIDDDTVLLCSSCSVSAVGDVGDQSIRGGCLGLDAKSLVAARESVISELLHLEMLTC